MTPAEALSDEAVWFARTLQNNPPKGLEPEVIAQRARHYQPQLTASTQHTFCCPKCWVRDGQRFALRPAPGTDEYDILRCDSRLCGAEIVIPF